MSVWKFQTKVLAKLVKQYIRLIRDTVDGERIVNDVRWVTQHHRIQASTGYRRAAEQLLSTLEEEGMTCRVLSYPFDEKRWYLASKSFMEWHMNDGWLDIESDGSKRVADFQTNATSIVQKSHPCDHRDAPLDIVMLDKGATEASCEALDLRGKLLFLRDDFNRYMDWAFTKKGAVGFVSDYLREVPGVRCRADLYDARNYTSFWWKDIETEPRIFGFVLTPRQGDDLAALCEKMAQDHKVDAQQPPYPKARCKIDAALYPGAIEVVECFLKGSVDEEILMVAHLCHPKPSANDNASGVASAMEATRVLRQLLEKGALPPLKRGIRILWVPEFAGSYAWLSDERNASEKIVAGINLDMVGGRQQGGYGPLTITSQPHAAPSIVTSIAAICLDEVKKNAHSLNEDGDVPMFNALISPFSAGSDHQLFSDPTINVPMPMLGQWPDKHYHTSADTVDRLDPFILHKSASIAAAYVYSLANLEKDDVWPLLLKEYQRFIDACAPVLAEEDIKARSMDQLCHLGKLHKAGMRDALRFFEQEDAAELQPLIETFTAMVDQQLEVFQKLGADADVISKDTERQTPSTAHDARPLRLYRSPIMRLEEYAFADEEKMRAYRGYMAAHHERVPNARTLELFIQYNIDGKRSVAEIAKALAFESGCDDVAFVHAYIQLLVDFGIVRLDD